VVEERPHPPSPRFSGWADLAITQKQLAAEKISDVRVIHKPDLTYPDNYGNIYSLYTLPPGGGLETTMEHDHHDNIQRLKIVEGHIRGIQRMLENDQYCIDIIRQIHAVQAALNKISANLLDGHLNSCLLSAIQGEDPAERTRVLKEITEVFETANKV
jgi:CsoR family transcriptional regulator, copper-sensing transcriptional repressor